MEPELLETVPATVTGKILKPYTRTAFREFIAQVLGWDVRESRCRFRYTSDPPQQALTNFAAADANVSV